MEYAEFIDINPEVLLNDNYTRYVGYKDTNNALQTRFFNVNTIAVISNKVTQLLQGVSNDNRKIIVPDHIISNVMDSVYINFRPQTGDIYSRYIIPNGENIDDYVQSMVDQTIEIIYSDVKSNIQMEQNNKTLSVWSTVLGDFNDNQLRSFPPIKILNKHPAYCQFNMNY
jgi:hypothetical protein